MDPIQIVSNFLDALASFRGVTLTAEQKIKIAKEYVDYFDHGDATNEEIAELFLTNILKHIWKTGRVNLKTERERRLRDEEEAELNAGDVNLIGPPPPPDLPPEPPQDGGDPV